MKMLKEKKDIRNQLVEILSNKIYPIIVELIQEIGLEYTDIEKDGYYTIRIMNNGDFKIKDEETIKTYSKYNKTKSQCKVFKYDTIEELRAQLLSFSNKIVELRKIKSDILEEIKAVKELGALSEEYRRELILEKI